MLKLKGPRAALRQDPDSELDPAPTSQQGRKGLAAPKAATAAAARQPKFGLGKTSPSLNAKAGNGMNRLPAGTSIKPANIRLGLMLGAALLLGGVSLLVNVGNRSTAVRGDFSTTALIPPVATIPAGEVAALTPPGDAASAISPLTPSGSSVSANTPPAAVTVLAGQPAANSNQNGKVSATKSGTGPKASVAAGTPSVKTSTKVKQGSGDGSGAAAQTTQAAETGPVIPDVFSSEVGDTSVTAQQSQSGLSEPASSQVSGLGRSLQPRVSPTILTVPSVPLSAVPQQIQVAPAVQMSLQSAPVPTVMTAAPIQVQQLQPLPTPVSVSNSPVVLTRPAQVILQPSTAPVILTAQAPATAAMNASGAAAGANGQTGGPLALSGIALGDIPTAIIDTPAGQLMAVVGDSVDVAGVSYVITAIKTTQVILSHGKTRITLTETK